MTVFACVDKNNGIMFNHRRQSQDREVRRRIEEEAASGRLYMSPYSARQWKDSLPQNAVVDENFLAKAGADDFCFVEDKDLVPFEDKICRLVLFRWDRVYPKDTSLPVQLSEWNLDAAEEFDGYSHPGITREVFVRPSAKEEDPAAAACGAGD